MKQTAVDFLLEELDWFFKEMTEYDRNYLITKSKEMEKEQKGYSKEDVIKIVEKSRETGLNAEYLLLTYKPEEDETRTN